MSRTTVINETPKPGRLPDGWASAPPGDNVSRNRFLKIRNRAGGHWPVLRCRL